MTTDIQQAAERRRKHNAAEGISAESPYHDPTSRFHRWPYTRQLDGDAWALADAFLAANPADDAEPVDADWLDSVLGPEHRAPLGAGDLNIYCWGEAEIIVQDNGHGGYGSCKHVIGLPDCKTRGDVRRLCQALGVQLSEAPCQTT